MPYSRIGSEFQMGAYFVWRVAAVRCFTNREKNYLQVLFRLPSQSFVRDYQRAQICIKEAIEYNEFDQVGDGGRKLKPDIIPAERNYVEDERQRLLQEMQGVGQSGNLSSILQSYITMYTRRHSTW